MLDFVRLLLTPGFTVLRVFLVCGASDEAARREGEVDVLVIWCVGLCWYLEISRDSETTFPGPQVICW